MQKLERALCWQDREADSLVRGQGACKLVPRIPAGDSLGGICQNYKRVPPDPAIPLLEFIL